MSSPDDKAGFSGSEIDDHLARLARQNGISTKAPHERPGHRAPQQPSDRELAAPYAEGAIRRHDLDDGIPHT